MARKTRRNARRARRASRHANPVSRSRRRNSFSLFKRRHANPALEGLASSLIAGGAGYVISKGISVWADQYLPASVPQPALIGAGVSAVAAVFVSEKFLQGRPRVAAAVQVGAMIPVAEELIKMTPLGPMLGLYESAPSAPSAGASSAALPAPGGVSASLAASLSEGSWNSAEY